MKRFATILLLVMALTMISACTTSTTPQASPSPSPSAMSSATPEASASPMASPSALASAMPVTELKAIGANVVIKFDDKDVKGTPYYDAQNEIILPLKNVAEAMGWKVEEATSGTQETMTLTRTGADDVTIAFTKPSLGMETATKVTAKKGTETVTVPDSLPFTDNMLYVHESFIDDVLEAVDVKLEGDQVLITPAA